MRKRLKRKAVVNCFQILYLCPSDTTAAKREDKASGCELLSDFISLSFGHNFGIQLIKFIVVVNCFQILYLCPSDTTLQMLAFYSI